MTSEYCCVWESPEGEQCGLMKNISYDYKNNNNNNKMQVTNTNTIIDLLQLAKIYLRPTISHLFEYGLLKIGEIFQINLCRGHHLFFGYFDGSITEPSFSVGDFCEQTPITLVNKLIGPNRLYISKYMAFASICVKRNFNWISISAIRDQFRSSNIYQLREKLMQFTELNCNISISQGSKWRLTFIPQDSVDSFKQKYPYICDDEYFLVSEGGGKRIKQ